MDAENMTTSEIIKVTIACFKKFDKDNSGSIDAKEFH